MKNNPPKVMDKWQIGLIIAYGVFQIISTVFVVQEYLFTFQHYEEAINGTLEIPLEIAIPMTICSLFSIMLLVWVVVRFITFKKRKSDYLLEQKLSD